MNEPSIEGCRHSGSAHSCAHSVLLPTVSKILKPLQPSGGWRLFDLGCGNGSVANYLTNLGWNLTGVDPSAEGISQAKLAYPNLKLFSGSAYEPLASK